MAHAPASQVLSIRFVKSKNKRWDSSVLQYYVIERFVYRLSKSKHAELFVLKGALLLSALDMPLTRSTKDIDLLGSIDDGGDVISTIVREICLQEVEADGLLFDENSVVTTAITEAANAGGVRVRSARFSWKGKDRAPGGHRFWRCGFSSCL